jgi:hypothetical protein
MSSHGRIATGDDVPSSNMHPGRTEIVGRRISGRGSAMLQDRDHRPPATLQELKYLIAKRQIVFPNSFKQVARQIIERPEMIAFESAAAIARFLKRRFTDLHSTSAFEYCASFAR